MNFVSSLLPVVATIYGGERERRYATQERRDTLQAQASAAETKSRTTLYIVAGLTVAAIVYLRSR